MPKYATGYYNVNIAILKKYANSYLNDRVLLYFWCSRCCNIQDLQWIV